MAVYIMGFDVYFFAAQSDPLEPGETVTLPYQAGKTRFSYQDVGAHFAVGPFEQLYSAPESFTVEFQAGGIAVTWGATAVPIGKRVLFQFAEVPNPMVDGNAVLLADLSNGTFSEFAMALLQATGPADLVAAGLAPSNSPSFSGLPTAPTAAPGTNTTQLATTAFVMAVKALLDAAIASLDASTLAALGLKAPLASPALTGTPTAPTPAVATNNTQLATTAFVATALTNAGTVFTTNLNNGLAANAQADRAYAIAMAVAL